MNFLIENSTLVVIVCIILYTVYKILSPLVSKLMPSKTDIECLCKDVNHISQKADNYSVNAESRLLNAKADLTEKMRMIQQETIEKADAKYVSKELDAQKTKQQEERMDKFESKLNNLENILSQVKTTGEVSSSKIDSIIDMLNK